MLKMKSTVLQAHCITRTVARNHVLPPFFHLTELQTFLFNVNECKAVRGYQ